MISKNRVIYYPSNAENLNDLKMYCEKMFRDIIERVNGDIEPTFVEQREIPKNPRTGTVYYASGVLSPGTAPFTVDKPTGWDPTYVNNGTIENPTPPNAVGTGKGLWIYTEVSGVNQWKRLDT